MPQVISIVPTLMWLQHRLGQSAVGSTPEDTEPHVSEKTIEFTPNRNIQATNVDTIGTSYSTDAGATVNSNKAGNLVTLDPTKVVHTQ
jgi:hypothetical protein